MANIIDDFFNAPTWREALSQVAARHQELLGDEAKASFICRIEQLKTNDAAYQVLSYYNDILQELSRGLVRDSIVYDGIPKLTDEHFIELCSVRDAATASDFVNRRPEIADFIVVEQVVSGPNFWRLLFSWAKLCVKSQSIQKRTTVIALQMGDAARRLVKVVHPLSDGGFSITAPYHNARSGSLFKAPRIVHPGVGSVAFSELVPYTASDRVKLSYHSDGFVQFSGEDNSKIRSGREDGVPRGLGLLTNPLSRPIQTGPSVICSVWGFEDFTPWVSRTKEATLMFERGDMYSEPPTSLEDGREGCVLSFFVFPSEQLEDAVGPISTGDELSMRLPMNIYHQKSVFRVRLIRVTTATVLGVIASAARFEWEIPSGFQLSSPSDRTQCLRATYPPIVDFNGAESLDHTPLL